jgi:hypothetical protein
MYPSSARIPWGLAFAERDRRGLGRRIVSTPLRMSLRRLGFLESGRLFITGAPTRSSTAAQSLWRGLLAGHLTWIM